MCQMVVNVMFQQDKRKKLRKENDEKIERTCVCKMVCKLVNFGCQCQKGS